MAVSGYLSALLVAFGAIVSVVGLYALSGWLRRSPGVLQAEPFLGGGASIEHAASRFHLRWYPVTLVGSSAVIEMFVFLAILLTGVGYAYREGALRWT
jgi:NADH-quinone oxidoreductase subunit A